MTCAAPALAASYSRAATLVINLTTVIERGMIWRSCPLRTTDLQRQHAKISVHSCAFVVSRWLMKATARWNLRFIAITAAMMSLTTIPIAIATTPQYQIYDIGVIGWWETIRQLSRFHFFMTEQTRIALPI